MKDIYELLRLKELEISRLEIEVEELRVVAPLLSENQESHDDQPTASRSTTPSQPTRVPKAVNANPQPEQAAVWEEKVKRRAIGVPDQFLDGFSRKYPASGGFNRPVAAQISAFAPYVELCSLTVITSAVGFLAVGLSLVVCPCTISEATVCTAAANSFVRRRRGQVAVGWGFKRDGVENLHSLDGE
jgi:hypothetical protein